MHSSKKLPKSHSFDGKKYKLRWKSPGKKDWGRCDDPRCSAHERYITVDPKLDRKDFFETLLHEAIHAEQWYLDEETVTRIAENLTNLLDKCDLIKGLND